MGRRSASSGGSLAAPCAARRAPCERRVTASCDGRRNPTDALPPTLVRAILLRLPADARARCACVCRSWRVAVDDPQLWLRLDLSTTSGLTCRFDDAAFRAATARAGGRLECLDVKGRPLLWPSLLEVVIANAQSLRELGILWAAEPELHRYSTSDDEMTDLEALLLEAPALQLLEADVGCTCQTAHRLLRSEPPWGPLQLRQLGLTWAAADAFGENFSSLAAGLIAHQSLTMLTLYGGEGVRFGLRETALVVDVALARGLTQLAFLSCHLSSAAVPALARLLGSTTLTELTIDNEDDPGIQLLDAPAASLLANALRANSTLQRLSLMGACLWDASQPAVTLLGALTGHVSVRTLDFSSSYTELLSDDVDAAIGAALGRLVAANAPALEELDIGWYQMGDSGVRPVIVALLRNTHLLKLRICMNHVSRNLAYKLARAVRFNTSLRELVVIAVNDTVDLVDCLNGAEEIVRRRECERRTAELAAGRSGA